MRWTKLIPFVICLQLLMCTKKKPSETAADEAIKGNMPQDNSHARFSVTAQTNDEIRIPWQPKPGEQTQLANLAAEAATYKPKDNKQGELLFKNHCSPCHGQDGRSGGPVADSLDVAPTNFHEWPIKFGRKPEEIALTISIGRNNSVMPAFGSALKKNDIWALTYLVSSWIDARTDKP